MVGITVTNQTPVMTETMGGLKTPEKIRKPTTED